MLSLINEILTYEIQTNSRISTTNNEAKNSQNQNFKILKNTSSNFVFSQTLRQRTVRFF